ncbi:MAG: hypothetical protein HY204_01645 [Nitrospirae bacterium]|nr:hypothetical protein [Nitrospirota bacterium]
MDSVLISVIVTGIFIVMTSAVGSRIGRSGKPYGVVKLAIHIILFLLITAGVIASAYKLQGVIQDKLYSTISLYATGLTLLTNFIIGIRMTIIKKVNPKLVLVHKRSTFLMGVSIIASIIFLTIKI